MNTITRPILIKNGQTTSCEGLLHVRSFSTRQRVIRAGSIWAIMWFFALLTAPLCGVHLITVPVLLVLGPVLGIKRYRMTEAPDHVSGTCPSGHEEFTLPLRTSDRLPMSASCPKCRASLHLLKKEEAPAS